ncbi:hypothetical protein B0J12DRAFT_787851 [Macrophomina phaseolina]|uniref:Uncharacterized protein n=1 Tax=Macrophomina phaseolina TaxID=35725 RepID=A0ABQ8G2G5_9PEZI|nr:hypothetical protein B0J12DRAFT_787851 [Macrophomina phaseolina]
MAIPHGVSPNGVSAHQRIREAGNKELVLGLTATDRPCSKNASTGELRMIFHQPKRPDYRKNLSTYEQATKFGLAFVSAYKATHNGALPYVAPQILSRWELATQNVDEETYQNLLGRKAAISRRASENLFKADPESCTDSLLITYYGPPRDSRLVLSSSDLNPSVSSLFAQVSALTAALQTCRGNNTYSSSSPPTPANIFRLVSLADMPMLILTLGEFASDGNYTYSNIPRQRQRLPYSVGLTARKGCDFVLSRIVRVLVEKGLVRTVAAGASVDGGSGGVAESITLKQRAPYSLLSEQGHEEDACYLVAK